MHGATIGINLKAVSYWCPQKVQDTIFNPYIERWCQSSEDGFRKRGKHPREVRLLCEKYAKANISYMYHLPAQRSPLS